MTASSSTSQYVLGSTEGEQERLIRQAARLDPYTKRLFHDAGIGPGQRILDIGSGVGDVAMLAARLVGPSGEIVGVERDERSIARAGTGSAGRIEQSNVCAIGCESDEECRVLRWGCWPFHFAVSP
jgi:predicted O-methyltransferase YrrM